MKHITLFVLIVLLVASHGLTAQTPTDNRTREIVFQSVNVIPMDRERVIENQDVVVKAGKITAWGTSGKIKFTKEALVIDGKGKFLMPGLAEMHAHVPVGEEESKEVLMLYAVNGITTIRGMLGQPRHLELREKIKSGAILGPRFYTSGPSFNGSSIQSPEAASRIVREQKAAGYDFLKLHPGLTLENFNAMVKTAHDVKIPFAGHVSYSVGVWRAIDAGYASIDHLDGFIDGLVPGIESIPEEEIGLFGLYAAERIDTAKIPALIKALKDHHIGVVPTQALADRWFSLAVTSDELVHAPEMKYMSAKTTAEWKASKENILSGDKVTLQNNRKWLALRRKLIRECQHQGVLLLLGSDAPQVFNVPGFSLHHELKYLVDAGLTPYEALRSGTVNMATYFKRTDLGILKVGNASDLLLLNGNPLAEITQSSNIAGVMLGNYWMDGDFIAKTLKRLEKQ